MYYEKLASEYLNYLMQRAQIDADGPDGYSELCARMQKTGFVSSVLMDENRNRDCRGLRSDFARLNHPGEYPDAADILDGIYGEYGTILEIIVILAERLEFEMKDSIYEAGVGKWTSELLTNCGLDAATNERMHSSGHAIAFCDIIENKLGKNKVYWDGEDGFFPLHWAKRDQRYLELMDRMNDYIESYYDIC